MPSGLMYEYEPVLATTYSQPPFVVIRRPCSEIWVPLSSEKLQNGRG